MSRFWERVSVGQRAKIWPPPQPSLLVYFGHPAHALVAGMTLSHAEPPTDGRWLSFTASICCKRPSFCSASSSTPTNCWISVGTYISICLCLYDCLRRTDVRKATCAPTMKPMPSLPQARQSAAAQPSPRYPQSSGHALSRLARSASSFCLMRLRFWHFQPSDTG